MLQIILLRILFLSPTIYAFHITSWKFSTQRMRSHVANGKRIDHQSPSNYFTEEPVEDSDAEEEKNVFKGRLESSWLPSQSNNMSPMEPSNKEEDDMTSNVQVNIPKTGVSLTDEIMKSQATNFRAELIPFDSSTTGDHLRLARIVTLPDPYQPIRYLVPFSSTASSNTQSYVMVDVPPFSSDLVQQITTFITRDNTVRGNLVAILITSRDAIHYDQSSSVYVTRKADIQKWKHAFPGIQVIMYRLDVPRDCKDMITQTLDGYGPWAWEPQVTNSTEEPNHSMTSSHGRFVETGRPLTRLEWDDTTKDRIFRKGDIPPDDHEDEELNKEDQHQYTAEAIRLRELDKRILAVYTPGHTFGSMTYIFPDSKVCCSGYTLPLEDTRLSDGNKAGITGEPGPLLDYRGFITTNQGGISRQVDSAKHILHTYMDRIDIVLPSKGTALFLQDRDIGEKTWLLRDVIDQWAELGRIYEDMGIL